MLRSAAFDRPRTLLLCLEEARPIVLLMFLLRFAAGVVLGNISFARAYPWSILVAAVAVECSVVAVYIFNGVMDQTEDRANGSTRPIARGALSPHTAQWYCVGFAGLAIVVAFFVWPLLAIPILALLSLGFAYSGPPTYLKRTAPGTWLTGVALGPLTYCAGTFATRTSTFGASWVTFAIAMALWTGLVGTTTKDLHDRVGDAASGRRTVAVIFGEARARRAAAAAAVVVPAVFTIMAILFVHSLLLPAAGTAVGGVATAAISLGSGANGPRHVQRRPYSAFMATQYVVHLLLLTAGARSLL